MSGQPKHGFSIRIFLPHGTPDGLRVVEKSNWTGRAIVCPRSQFPEAKARAEFGRTAVYVLRGPSESGDLPTIYVGEGDPARPRLESHYAAKDFWTSLILFTSKDDNLNKAHVQYLEARLVALAKQAKRCILDNANFPQLPSLSEPDLAEIEGFLEEMLLIYPVLGITAFERPQPPPARLLYVRSKGILARGYDAPQGFVVLAGSQAVRDPVPSIPTHALELRKSLTEREILLSDGELLKLAQDYTFDSPSTAADVVLGRSANGRTEWKDDSGVTLKEIQTAAVEDH